jgi:hypothetical protein
MDHRHERYLELQAELEGSLGFQYLQGRKFLEGSLKVFAGNFRQFADLVDLIQDPRYYLQQTYNKNSEELHSEIIRLFHNYLAAVKSLIDHTRSYVDKRHANAEFESKYKFKIKELFIESNVSSMIIDLRNYLLHRGIPPSTIRETFYIGTDKPPEIQIAFKISTLGDWKGWASKSKKFMKNSGSYFGLKPLVAEYQNLVVHFYNWFDSELDSIHRAELEEFENLERKITEFEQGTANKAFASLSGSAFRGR